MSGTSGGQSVDQLVLLLSKASEEAAQKTADLMSAKLKLEMRDMESRLSSEVSETVDAKLNKFLGMSPTEHAIEHDHCRTFLDSVEIVKSTWIKRMTNAAIALIAVLAISVSSSKLPAITIHKPEIKTVPGTNIEGGNE